MIPLTDAGWQSQSWQALLSSAITDINELVSLLDIDVPLVSSDFPLLVPLPYLSRIEHGNPSDPLLLQVLPAIAEYEPAPGYTEDALEEMSQAPVPGLLHKYHGRVLVVMSGACAVNCRYCFRRHFPYGSFQPDTSDWERIFNYIEQDTSISEVILSGGDPLVQSDTRLEQICQRLESIAHVRTLRIHTRLPVVIPQRICDALIDWIRDSRLRTVMVIHANHPQEIDKDVSDAMAKLRAAGVELLNQSVLLNQVNDDVLTLCTLSERLFEVGVMPYYLHRLDRVSGTAHFDIPDSTATRLHEEMSARLPGYLLPRLVREIPGASSKTDVRA